ncbi:NAD-dependent epimerase/dehydratase family protein [Aggregatilinea lenta]|uniref:NAD-dependent epimerase/dehydratase family protein n=1 Tax=Aggregatilinea lenta TaxID=913108 RepID=UPI000E5A6676|nr:NAD-dependent epimerase/dehydratase family protein [Aggregatilinea lenta]
MRILILGGDGYLGWPTAMYFSKRGHTVAVVDNFTRRMMHLERGTDSLTPIQSLQSRVEAWHNVAGCNIEMFIGDIKDWYFISHLIRDFQPDTIVHYGEIPSAPYSMIDVHHAVQVHENNVNGTLNVLWAMHEFAPDAHLVKLGTMGEYGTPNVDIPEGYFTIEYKGRTDTLPFPKQPGSFYHLTKVHDSNNIMFACKVWGLRATDLNQGVVYGIETDESNLDDRLLTRFDYDESFGTALNRFCVQAVAGIPLTLFGRGQQTRGYLNIRDTLQCIELSALNPPTPGKMRVFNQWVERFSVMDLAKHVKKAAREAGIDVTIAHYRNPRVEAEEHYYNPDHTGLFDLGLKPHYLSDSLVESVIRRVVQYRDRIMEDSIVPRIYWERGGTDDYVEIVEVEDGA